MCDKSNKQTQQELDSDYRYRQLVSSISDAVVQIGNDKKWLFLSPVWKKLSGHHSQSSLNNLVVDSFHPVDAENIKHVLTSLFEGEQQSWTGEVRLKKSDKRLVWVEISLYINSDEQSEKTVSGIIKNVHIERLNREVNQLVRTTEQMVLSSNCSVTDLLELVTQELVYILGVTLAWVKLCQDNKGQILHHAGQMSDFLFDSSKMWSGLHHKDGPIIEAVDKYSVVRVTDDSKLIPEWQQRLKNDEIKDSLFVPFYIGGDTKAVIGLHTHEADIFDDDIQQVMVNFAAALRLICQMAEDQKLMHLHRAAVENTANSIMITDAQGYIEWVNNAFIKITKYQSEDVLGKTPRVLKSNENKPSYAKDIWDTIQSGEVWVGEIINKCKNGDLVTVYQTVTPIIDYLGEITNYVAVSEDVTERKADQERIAFMATHDELTKLPNRNLLHDRLEQAIEHAKRNRSKMAVLFIDIDHFKFINDSLGHQIGDELLKVLAKRLSSVLRKEDTVARFGGDEFVVILPETSTLADIKNVANNLLYQIKETYHIQEHELVVTGSIGISIYPSDATDADDLIQHADSAMYLAKEQGRNNSQFYTPEINDKLMRRMTMEKALRKAIEHEELILHYQPKVDLSTQKIVGMEALVRWQHPELGLVSPIEFIPLAEETGLILPLGEWVMSTACKQMKAWELHYPDLQNMSINVSARQFWQKDFVETAKYIIEQSRVSIEKVEFELTESVVMDDIESAISTMEELKAFGIALSIDDFGTGYSSLSYLQRFPVDVLKIDQSFIADLKPEQSSSAIVRSILALAENFSLRVVAEGIENDYQRQILRSLGCHYGQGYYFSRPESVDEITKKLV